MIKKATKTINRVGNSLTINVTPEVRALGLDRGDKVDVTLEPRHEDKTVLEIISYPMHDTDFQTIRATRNGALVFVTMVMAGQYSIRGQVFTFFENTTDRQTIRFDELIIRNATPDEIGKDGE